MNFSVVSPVATSNFSNNRQAISNNQHLKQSLQMASSHRRGDTICFGASGSEESKTPNAFTLAAQRNQVHELRRLGKEGVNELDGRGMTPLTVATSRGHLKAIQVLCQELDADVDKPENHGHTPLMIAIIKGNLPAVQLLLSANANLQIEDKKHQTAMVYARKLLTNDKDPLRTNSKAILAAIKEADQKYQTSNSSASCQSMNAPIFPTHDFTIGSSEKHLEPSSDKNGLGKVDFSELPDSPVFELPANDELKLVDAHYEKNGKHYTELVGDTGAAELDSQSIYEMSHEARPVPTHINIEPDGFPLQEFQEQANRATQPKQKNGKKLLKRLSGLFECLSK